MTILFFSAIDKKGHHRSCSLGGESLESDLDMLTHMIHKGWSLESVDLLLVDHLIHLPVEAFDGHSFTRPIQQLKQEWESILYKG